MRTARPNFIPKAWLLWLAVLSANSHGRPAIADETNTNEVLRFADQQKGQSLGFQHFHNHVLLFGLGLGSAKRCSRAFAPLFQAWLTH
jgi:hypothetical protein